MTEKRDPRLDKAAGWLINGLSAIALSVGAFFFHDLSGDLKELSKAVTDLGTEVAVMRVTNKRIDDLAAEIKTIRAEQLRRTSNVYAVKALSADVAELKKRTRLKPAKK